MTEGAVRGVMSKTGLSQEAALTAILEEAGQGRLISADEVAQTVVALCADDAAERTGQTLVMDGNGPPDGGRE